MYLSKLVHTETGRIIASVILGLGLATLFRSVCEGKNCIIYMAPEDIQGKIYKHNSKCYTYSSNTVKCK